jgi:homoserine dehydrogenase
MTTASIAVAGCGAVGGALVERLAVNSHDRFPGVELDRILVRDACRPERLARRDLEFVDDLDAFLDTDAGIVVEAIGGLDPALRIARATLERRASLITANKALIARHGAELQRLADANGGRLLFEGAVAGGVPVLRTIRHSFPGVRIRRISGILNGTCNWVLTELERGTPFDVALTRAQQLGYAEADPSRDLDGRDAADKIAILAWLAWGADPVSVHVRTEGLPADPARLVHEAIAAGLSLRLVADCQAVSGTLEASVRLALVPAASAFGSTTGVDNCVRIETDGAGDYVFSGPGAGGAATAAAILSDIVWMLR